MDSTIDIDSWMNRFTTLLHDTFGQRLIFVGLQGSRARGEARDGSDIDAVVIIDELSSEDLRTYQACAHSLPHSDILCGFVSAPDMLAHWPRSDSFNLVMDTKGYFGSLDFMDTNFSKDEARAAACAGACEMYHALCHGLLFETEMLPDIVAACTKSAFFVMRANTYAKCGEYAASRTRMRELATPIEQSFLDAYDTNLDVDPASLAESLIAYAESIACKQ